MNWATEGSGSAILGGNDAGDLTIENCLFYNINNGDQYLISWVGASNSKVNVVSSRLLGAGGMLILGETNETNIVNSTFTTQGDGLPNFAERFRNLSTGPINITASSLRWNSNQCGNLTSCSIAPLILIESNNGVINIKESALGFNDTGNTGTLIATLGVTGSGAGFTADTKTWIQPTPNQDAATLKSITGQTLLLTDLPGFKPNINTQIEYNDLELLAPDVSGVLIDVISNSLMNPIDGSNITNDVLGNQRFDANGFRDIGAIQLGLAPKLTITGSGDGFVDLSWQEPLHHDGDPIVRYEYQYVPTSGGSPTLVGTGTNLSATITGLTNGTEYEFSVRAVYNENGTEFNGPLSNTEIETTFGNLESPTLTLVSGTEEVAVTWTTPNLGGRTFEFYDLLWKEVGASSYTGGDAFNSITDLSTIVENLSGNTNYEFSIFVRASGESSTFGTSTAISYGALQTPTLTATPGNGKVNLSWNIPDLGGRTFEAYDILWKEQGGPILDGIDINDVNITSTDINGLTNGVTYEFEIFVLASNEKSSSSFATATPDSSLSSDSINLINNKFTFYPIPSKNKFHIRTKEEFKGKLFSVNGSLLLDTFTEKSIDLSNYSKGIFILQIEFDNKLYFKKIIKN